MSRFIRLTNLIINTQNISDIKHNNFKYIISLKIQKINGFTIFGSGIFNTYYEKYIFCKEKEETDYIAIHNWIDTLDSKGWLYEGNGNSVLECNKYCKKVTFIHSNSDSK